jgi:hypothetical protein
MSCVVYYKRRFGTNRAGGRVESFPYDKYILGDSCWPKYEQYSDFQRAAITEGKYRSRGSENDVKAKVKRVSACVPAILMDLVCSDACRQTTLRLKIEVVYPAWNKKCLVTGEKPNRHVDQVKKTRT